MAAASAVVGVSLRSLGRVQRALTLAAGVFSIVFGIAWSVPLWAQIA